MNGSGNRGVSPGGMALLRAAVAGYLIYLGVTLVRDRLNGTSAMAPWLAWACGAVFVLAGAAFGWYAWRKYRAETAKESPGPAEEPAGPEALNGPETPEIPAEPDASSEEEEKGTSA